MSHAQRMRPGEWESQSSLGFAAATAHPSHLVQVLTWAGRGGSSPRAWRQLPELGHLASMPPVGWFSSLAPGCGPLEPQPWVLKSPGATSTWAPRAPGTQHKEICLLLSVCELAPYLTNLGWVWDITAMCGGYIGGGREDAGGSDPREWLLFILSCCICWVTCEILFIDLMSCGIRCHLWLCSIDHTYV